MVRLSKLRGPLGLSVGAVMAVLFYAAAASACTAQSTMSVNSPAAASGAKVLVSGTVLQEEPVEIRWNTSTGPALATPALGANKSYVGEVPIPQVSPGVYLMVLTAGGEAVARVAIEVTGDGRQSTGAWNRPSGSAISPEPGGSSVRTVALMLLSLGLVVLAAAGLLMTTLTRRRAAAANSVLRVPRHPEGRSFKT